MTTDDPRPYCKPHTSHFCPCCKPELYDYTDPKDVEYIRGWEKVAPIVPVVVARKPEPAASEGEMVWCPDCGSMGVINGVQCRRCLGKGVVLKQEGTRQATDALGAQEWIEEADVWFDALPPGTCFWPEDLGEGAPFPPKPANRNNKVGGWYSGKATAGRMEMTGRFRRSSRPSAHVRKIFEWRKVR